MIDQEDIRAVEQFIAHNGKPMQVSLSDRTHLFYFHRSDWRASPLVFVNKNGNYCRLIREADGNWFCADTWNSLFDYQPWMRKITVRSPDPDRILAMVSPGPAHGKSETPCLFPKECFTAWGRKACFRWGVVDVKFKFNEGTFSIGYTDHNGASQYRSFQGKPWESREAGSWLMADFGGASPTAVSGEIENPFERQVAHEKFAEALEDNPLFGAFG